MSLVAVVRNENIYEATLKALEKVDANLDGNILIKPNLVMDVSLHRRACTNPKVIEAIIDFIESKGGKAFVGESSMVGCDTLKAYEKSGLKEVCERKGIKFIDFNRCKPIKININGEFIKEVIVAKDLLNFDKIISVPVMKTHVLTGVTLSLKNMKGIQYRNEKIKLHSHGMKMLHVGIVDIVTHFKPYMAVIDASYAQEGEGPVGGDIIKMDLIIASRDCVAADATACRIMGINPHEIGHIKMAWERGLGEIDDIEIVGDDINKIKRKFKHPLSGIKRAKYKFLDIGMDILAKLKGTSEEERAYKILMEIMETKPYITKLCKKCKKCVEICPNNAIDEDTKTVRIDYERCKACMICMEACPFNAIKSKEISVLKASKEIVVTLTRAGIKAIFGKLR